MVISQILLTNLRLLQAGLSSLLTAPLELIPSPDQQPLRKTVAAIHDLEVVVVLHGVPIIPVLGDAD